MTTFSVSQEGPVNALALNKDNTQVAIGGRNVFKVYSIEDDGFKEVCNLRASKHLNLSFSCNDVSWSTIEDNYLATAATNGHVCVWNLTKMGKAMQEQDYQEHKRTVNKVNFHATEPSKLISGSQDGTMRYFDIRTKNAVAIFYSNTESVRDVQFSPHMPHTFASVSENGSVQIWDVRKSDKSTLQFAAHSGPIFACDWHPENTWLATASRDKTIKVWDLTGKPALEYTIHTIASIGHVKWRPQRKYHIASCALVVDCSINIWDVRRPYIPFASFNEHKDIASRVAWRGDPKIFLSTGRDYTLFHHTFKDANRPANKANPQGLSLSNRGDVLYAHKVPTNCNSFTKIIRKPSSSDYFHQVSSSLHRFDEVLTQDPNCFYDLAVNYILTGRSFSDICEHNANVSKKFGKNSVAIIWQIIKTMYGDEFYENSLRNSQNDDVTGTSTRMIGMDILENDQRPKGGDTPAVTHHSGGDDETENEDQVDHVGIYNNGFSPYSNIRKHVGDFSFGEPDNFGLEEMLSIDYSNGLRNSHHLIPQHDDWTLPNEGFNPRHEIIDRAPPTEHFSSHHNSPDINDDTQTFTLDDQSSGLLNVSNSPKRPLWDPSNTVVDALKFHANMGDIQTTACVLTVLGAHERFLSGLDEVTQEHWLLGYIDLLSRYKLWDVATQIIKLSWIPSVNQLNHQSTRYNTNCNRCNKRLQKCGWLCDNKNCPSSESVLCSVCHQVVKGLYAWCQGCSHGGHLIHIQKWMSINKMCPTGCGHMCEYR